MEISSSRIKKFLIYQGMELSGQKKLPYISRQNLQSPKTNKQKIHSEEISYISPKKVLLAFCDGC